MSVFTVPCFLEVGQILTSLSSGNTQKLLQVPTKYLISGAVSRMAFSGRCLSICCHHRNLADRRLHAADALLCAMFLCLHGVVFLACMRCVLLLCVPKTAWCNTACQLYTLLNMCLAALLIVCSSFLQRILVPWYPQKDNTAQTACTRKCDHSQADPKLDGWSQCVSCCLSSLCFWCLPGLLKSPLTAQKREW